jgi:hypothetical protein
VVRLTGAHKILIKIGRKVLISVQFALHKDRCILRFVSYMEKILRHSHFESNAFGDGGSKRTAQITEILEDHGIPYIYYDPDLTKIFKKKYAALDGIQAINKYQLAATKDLKTLTQLGFNYYKRLKTLEAYREKHSIFLWESTRDMNYLFAYAARESGFNLIGLPHNLESLVPGQVSAFTGKKAPEWWDEELKALSMCHHVFSISREEQWLLKLFQVPNEFLPYYPPRQALQSLLSIRERRQTKVLKNVILLMGTAGNKPTFKGMLDRILFFHKIADKLNLELHVAGYLTEMLEKHIPASNKIRLHGTVSQEKLEELLSICNVVWIHQEISTGSLTRIPEMLIAGVPLLLNAEASRSFYNTQGLLLYESEAHCEELLSTLAQQNINVPLPGKPVAHEEEFVATIKKMAY